MSAYAVSSRGLAAHKVPQGVLATIMEMLYSNSEKGIAKLDFSDFTGMYQDRARTIPYTAVEQPLGSFTGLNGVTATAPADVNRGVVSARVNLTQNAHKIANWTDGNNADYADYFGPGIDGVLLQTKAGTDSPNTSVYSAAKANDVFSVSLLVDIGPSTPGSISFNLLRYYTGTPYAGVTLTRDSRVLIDSTFGTGSVLSSSMTNVSGDIFKISFTAKIGTDSDNGELKLYASTNVPLAQVFILGKLQITTATDAHLPYQRVNTPTDYDTAGFPHYLAFNGTNTAYVTPSIDFTGTDKMTVWAGVTKLSDANLAVITELSNGAVDGVISLQAPFGSASPSFLYLSRGSTSQWAATVAYPSPSTAVLTGVSDISGDVVSLRVNATVVATTTTDQGVGNYGNYPLYIGSRSGASNYFNGRLYTLIVRGAQSSLSQIEAVETLIRQKMRLP